MASTPVAGKYADTIKKLKDYYNNPEYSTAFTSAARYDDPKGEAEMQAHYARMQEMLGRLDTLNRGGTGPGSINIKTSGPKQIGYRYEESENPNTYAYLAMERYDDLVNQGKADKFINWAQTYADREKTLADFLAKPSSTGELVLPGPVTPRPTVAPTRPPATPAPTRPPVTTRRPVVTPAPTRPVVTRPPVTTRRPVVTPAPTRPVVTRPPATTRRPVATPAPTQPVVRRPAQTPPPVQFTQPQIPASNLGAGAGYTPYQGSYSSIFSGPGAIFGNRYY